MVLSCIFHPSQLLLVSGGDDSQIKIWDLISKTCVATLQAHFSAVTSLAISEDGWTLLSAGRDGVECGPDPWNFLTAESFGVGNVHLNLRGHDQMAEALVGFYTGR